MHVGNVQWLRDLDGRYATSGARLLELGSLNVNGTARSHIEAREWVGIDIVAGGGVDIVCPAKETTFAEESFDIILCTSMLEHDPDWRESLTHNLPWLAPGGLLFLSWGAEGNTRHDPEPWAMVPVAEVRDWASKHGLVTIETCWERDRYVGDCAGCYDMVLRKQPLLPAARPLGIRCRLCGGDPHVRAGNDDGLCEGARYWLAQQLPKSVEERFKRI